MKKFNKNILLFVFFAVFVVVGLWGNCFGQLGTEVKGFVYGLAHGEITAFNKGIDEISSKKLSYHELLMDINSVKDNLLGVRVSVEKDVVKSDSGSLIKVSDEMTAEQIGRTVRRIAELQAVAEDSGAKFLYCAVPDKSYYEQAPTNAPDYNRQNYSQLMKQLAAENVPYLNFVDYFAALDVIDESDLYYRTDHHWTTHAGFLAAGKIWSELNERYGVSVQDELYNANNYLFENYPDHFLGSYGKKVGTYFAWGGADDFELITPDFETDFYEENTVTNQIVHGDFESVLLNKDRLKKDYYNFSTYNTYMATNKQHVRVVKNNLRSDGAKVLIVQTSFGQVVSPFLALNCSEIHICDMRTDQGIEGERPNLEEYINEIKPDVVIMLFNGVTDVEISDGRYDFF